MRQWLLVPYDGSAVTRATLRRAATEARQGALRQTGVLLATAGIEPEAVGDLLHEAGTVAGPNVVLWARLLDPGDPLGSLRHLIDTLPNAVLTVPVDTTGVAPWCAAACRLAGLTPDTMLFFLSPEERGAVALGTERGPARPPGLARALGRLVSTLAHHRA